MIKVKTTMIAIGWGHCHTLTEMVLMMRFVALMIIYKNFDVDPNNKGGVKTEEAIY